MFSHLELGPEVVDEDRVHVIDGTRNEGLRIRSDTVRTRTSFQEGSQNRATQDRTIETKVRAWPSIQFAKDSIGVVWVKGLGGNSLGKDQVRLRGRF